MKSLKVVLSFLALSAALASPVLADGENGNIDMKFADDYQKSVAILLAEDFQGGYSMRCTATAIERNGNVYRFVSAAHCVAEDEADKGRVKVDKSSRLHLTFDREEHKTVVYSVKLVGVGMQGRGDDFAVLEAVIDDRVVPLVPFAPNAAERLEPVINVAVPGGLGKQVFTGHVSSNKLDRPVVEGDINWEGAIMLQMASAGGSSGSAIVSLKQKGIVAFLVGGIGGGGNMNIIALPAKRFLKFYDKIKAGKYRYWKPSTENDDEDQLDCYYWYKPDGTIDKSRERLCKPRGESSMPSDIKSGGKKQSLQGPTRNGPLMQPAPSNAPAPGTKEFRAGKPDGEFRKFGR